MGKAIQRKRAIDELDNLYLRCKISTEEYRRTIRKIFRNNPRKIDDILKDVE